MTIAKAKDLKKSASRRLFLAASIAATALFAFAQSAQASSVVWNTTMSGAAGICRNGCAPNEDTYGFNNPNITVQYRAFIKNVNTGEIIPPGGTVTAGTHLQLIFDKHVSSDIYWFATGSYYDSPYGDWGNPDVEPPVQCLDKDYLGSNNDLNYSAPYAPAPPWLNSIRGRGRAAAPAPAPSAAGNGVSYNHYVPFVVRAPEKAVGGISTLLSCGGIHDGVQDCRAVAEGSVPLMFNFGQTVGKFYARHAAYGFGGLIGCYGFPGTMTIKYGAYWPSSGYGPWVIFSQQPGATTNQVDVASQSIPYPINIVKAADGPSDPVISGGACQVGAPYSISFSSTDPNGARIRYGIDWDDNGTVDQYVPPSGYARSGSVQSATRTYSTSGLKNIRIVAQNDRGTYSSWAKYSFSCGENRCPVGYIKQGDQCVFSACPAGYVKQAAECVKKNQCTSLPRCSGANLVDGCTGDVMQACEWGCASGRCNDIPAPTAFLYANPSLIPIGRSSIISWNSQDTVSCKVAGTNGDSWTGKTSSGKTSKPIQGQTTFNLRCEGYSGADPSYVEKSVTVNLVPTFNEK